jgi:hypothetical protein
MRTFKGLTSLIILILCLNALHAVNEMPVIASFQGEHHNSKYGYSMTSLDFNHDGIDDLAVCAFSYGYVYGESQSRGKVYIYLGGTDFSSTTPASMTLEGDYDGRVGRLIRAVYKVGDINGDGFDDLCVSVTDHVNLTESYAKLLFYYGGTPDLGVPDHEMPLYDFYNSYVRVYPLGDVNGDGYDDMGFYYTHDPTRERRHSVIFGGTFEEQVLTSIGEISSSYASCIHGIGDINNDGYDDFTSAFATPQSNPTHNLIRLYYGNAECNFDNPVTFLYCQYGVSRGSKPLGDMNGDGYADFMGYITNDGMHIWLGGQDINYEVPSFNFNPPWFGSDSQHALKHGDFNGDGYADAAGAGLGRGFAVWLGKRNVNGTADLIVYNGTENYGWMLATGDFNGDGYDDIAVTASHEYDPWPDGNFNGYVWVYAGNAQLKDTTVAIDDPAIPSVSGDLLVKLSPNPITWADNTLNIELQSKSLNGHEQVAIEIYNIKGQSVLKEVYQSQLDARTYRVPASSLANGIYFCRVTCGKQQATGKFCVIK